MSKPNVAEATKSKVGETIKSIAKVVKNTELFVQTIALLVTAIVAYQALQGITNAIWYWIVAVSLVVIALRGSYEFFKFMSRGE